MEQDDVKQAFLHLQAAAQAFRKACAQLQAVRDPDTVGLDELNEHIDTCLQEIEEEFND